LHFQESELDRLTRAREAELKYVSEQNDLELTKAKEMAAIETSKFKNMVDAVGTNTLAAIANAGPEMQVCTFLFTNSGSVFFLSNSGTCE
jgi:major vault protein